MTVQYSTSVRNAMLDAIESATGTSAKLQMWSGTQPTNCGTAIGAQVKLVEIALASDWAAAASGGSKTYSSVPLATTALAAGTVGFYRVVDSAGTTCHEQGTITATGGGGDMTIDNTVLASGQTVQVTGFTKTAPGA